MVDLLEMGKKKGTSINLAPGHLQLLDLISLSKEKSRSAIVIEMLDLRQDEVSQLTETIMLRLWSEWQETTHSFTDFLKLANNWLHKNRIAKVYIETIIQELKNKHEKE